MLNFYRPQRSCEGYLFTGVCLSTGGGGGIPACLAAGLQGGVLSQHALQKVSGGGAALGGVCSQGVAAPRVCVCVWRPPPPRQQTATVADSTHPTGMQSCIMILLRAKFSGRFLRKIRCVLFPSEEKRKVLDS